MIERPYSPVPCGLLFFGCLNGASNAEKSSRRRQRKLVRSSKRTCMKAPSLPLHWVKQLPEPCNAYRTPIENAGLMGVPV